MYLVFKCRFEEYLLKLTNIKKYAIGKPWTVKISSNATVQLPYKKEI